MQETRLDPTRDTQKEEKRKAKRQKKLSRDMDTARKR